MTRSPKHSAGFNLLELMITVSLAGVLLGIGVPAFNDVARNNRLTTAVNDLLHSTQVARSEAITRRLPVVVCASDDASAAEPVCNDGAFTQWIVFVDTDGDWGVDGGEPVLERHPPLHETVTVSTDGNGIISYAPNGFASVPVAAGKVPSSRIVICDARGNQQVGDENSAARAVVVEATGRARFTKKRTEITDAIAVAGACP